MPRVARPVASRRPVSHGARMEFFLGVEGLVWVVLGPGGGVGALQSVRLSAF